MLQNAVYVKVNLIQNLDLLLMYGSFFIIDFIVLKGDLENECVFLYLVSCGRMVN